MAKNVKLTLDAGVAFPDGKGSLIGGSEDRSPTVT